MVKVCVWTLQCIDPVNIIAIVILMFFTEKKKDLDGVVKVLHLETQLSLLVVCLKEPPSSSSVLRKIYFWELENLNDPRVFQPAHNFCQKSLERFLGILILSLNTTLMLSWPMAMAADDINDNEDDDDNDGDDDDDDSREGKAPHVKPEPFICLEGTSAAWADQTKMYCRIVGCPTPTKEEGEDEKASWCRWKISIVSTSKMTRCTTR